MNTRGIAIASPKRAAFYMRLQGELRTQAKLNHFNRRARGRTTFNFMVLQHSIPGKRMAALQRCDECLRTGKWKNDNDFTLLGLVPKHQQSCVEMSTITSCYIYPRLRRHGLDRLFREGFSSSSHTCSSRKTIIASGNAKSDNMAHVS